MVLKKKPPALSLPVEHIETIRKIFSGEIEVIAFGSRVTGRAKASSDLDLCIRSQRPITLENLSRWRESLQKSNLPYRVDLSLYTDLPQVFKRVVDRDGIDLMRESHPVRPCPLKMHWVREHARKGYPTRGHCRLNPSRTDQLYGHEIEELSKKAIRLGRFAFVDPQFKGNSEMVAKLAKYWVDYWNLVFRPSEPLQLKVVLALVASESGYNPQTINRKNRRDPAYGLTQLLKSTIAILKDEKGELKDHYVDITQQQSLDPSMNLAAAVRWLFRKRETALSKLGREPSWMEVIADYKGTLRKRTPESWQKHRDMQPFLKILSRYETYEH